MAETASVAELLGGLDFDPAALKTKYLAGRDKRLSDNANDQYVEVTVEFSRDNVTLVDTQGWVSTLGPKLEFGWTISTMK